MIIKISKGSGTLHLHCCYGCVGGSNIAENGMHFPSKNKNIKYVKKTKGFCIIQPKKKKGTLHILHDQQYAHNMQSMFFLQNVCNTIQ